MNSPKLIIMGAFECAAFLTLIATLMFAWVVVQDGDIINLKAVLGW